MTEEYSGSAEYRRLIRLHEAAHATMHIVLNRTECLEIQIGGPLELEQGWTFSLLDDEQPCEPFARAVAALAGPVINALFATTPNVEERKFLWRGTIGDFAQAHRSMSAGTPDAEGLHDAWDVALELINVFLDSIEALAQRLEDTPFMAGQDATEIVLQRIKPSQLSARAHGVLKPAVQLRLTQLSR